MPSSSSSLLPGTIFGKCYSGSGPNEGYRILPTSSTASSHSRPHRDKMPRPRRTQYFYNILLLIILSLILYLFSSQLLSQSGGGAGGNAADSSNSNLNLINNDAANINAIELVAGYSGRRSSNYSGLALGAPPQVVTSSSASSLVLSNDFTIKTGLDGEGDDNSEENEVDNLGRHQGGDGGGEGKTTPLSVTTTNTDFQQTTATTKDWIKTFSETAHKLYAMFSPDYLKEFRKWAVQQQRQAIDREMKGYKFQTGKNAKLNDFIMEKGGQPVRNVIFTTWRSGSTFLGETLDSHPGTFYHYEPLLHFDIKQVRSGPLAKEGLRVLNQLLSCNYTGLNDYMAYGKTHHWLYSHNTRIWQYCEKSYDVCWDPKFLSDMCRLFPFQSVKTVRMRLRLAKTLLENKKFNLRLLLLVRDPRGTMQSRNHRDWCPEDPDCYDPSKLCMDMIDDFNYAEKLRQRYPDRFLAIRYEDMSISPYESMQKIFKFFRLQYHPQVEKFLSSHTTENVGGVSSTFRDSKTTPFHWRTDFVGNFSLVTEIQNRCDNAMKLWGYAAVDDPDQLLKFNPLKRPPWPEMFVLNSTQVHDEMYVK